jgi:hypothetical protein
MTSSDEARRGDIKELRERIRLLEARMAQLESGSGLVPPVTPAGLCLVDLQPYFPR